jgi:hypothetical protein
MQHTTRLDGVNFDEGLLVRLVHHGVVKEAVLESVLLLVVQPIRIVVQYKPKEDYDVEEVQYHLREMRLLCRLYKVHVRRLHDELLSPQVCDLRRS